MRHVLELFTEICPRTAANIEETSPLLLQHVEHGLKDATRVLLKLLSIGFPKEFNVGVILEGLESYLGQVHAAIQVSFKFEDYLTLVHIYCICNRRKCWRTCCLLHTKDLFSLFCSQRYRQKPTPRYVFTCSRFYEMLTPNVLVL